MRSLPVGNAIRIGLGVRPFVWMMMILALAHFFSDRLGRTTTKRAMPPTSAIPARIGATGFIAFWSLVC